MDDYRRGLDSAFIFCSKVHSVPRASFFDRESSQLVKAARCTVFLHVEVTHPRGHTQRQFGTAFFIDPKHLVTAGHNVFVKETKDSTKRIRITYPGLSHVNYTQLMDGEISTIDCTLIKSFYIKDGSHEKDIALLHAGSHNSADFVHLPTDIPVTTNDNLELVDVIGYPGEFNSKWMKTQKVKDVDQSLDAVAKLLPRRTLTVTRGVLKSISTTVAYDLSTCPGMSGSCVLYKGNVIGISHSNVKN
jgi:V8-like Glu-specific endopeptidase